jgi:hypothetical protein
VLLRDLGSAPVDDTSAGTIAFVTDTTLASALVDDDSAVCTTDVRGDIVADAAPLAPPAATSASPSASSATLRASSSLSTSSVLAVSVVAFGLSKHTCAAAAAACAATRQRDDVATNIPTVFRQHQRTRLLSHYPIVISAKWKKVPSTHSTQSHVLHVRMCIASRLAQ